MFKNNPEEFITKVIRLINEQKATMIVEHISYDTIEGEYDSTIFTAEKNTQSFDKAFLAKKAIQESGKFIPWQVITIGIDGNIIE